MVDVTVLHEKKLTKGESFGLWMREALFSCVLRSMRVRLRTQNDSIDIVLFSTPSKICKQQLFLLDFYVASNFNTSSSIWNMFWCTELVHIHVLKLSLFAILDLLKITSAAMKTIDSISSSGNQNGFKLVDNYNVKEGETSGIDSSSLFFRRQ